MRHAAWTEPCPQRSASPCAVLRGARRRLEESCRKRAVLRAGEDERSLERRGAGAWSRAVVAAAVGSLAAPRELLQTLLSAPSGCLLTNCRDHVLNWQSWNLRVCL